MKNLQGNSNSSGIERFQNASIYCYYENVTKTANEMAEICECDNFVLGFPSQAALRYIPLLSVQAFLPN